MENQVEAFVEPSNQPVKTIDPFFESLDQKPFPKSFVGWFFEALMCPQLGMRILLRKPHLMLYALIPIAIQTVISLVLLAIIFFISLGIRNAIASLIFWLTGQAQQATQGTETLPDDPTLWEWIFNISYWIVIIVIFYFVFTWIWKLTGGLICGYFGGKLTDRAVDEMGIGTNKFQTTMAGQLTDTGISFGMIAAGTWVAPFLGAIPVIGPFVLVPALAVWTFFVHGFDELKTAFAQFGFSRRDSFGLCLLYKSATIGAGAVKGMAAPIPAIGGLIIAAEDLGRIGLCYRILRHREQKLGQQLLSS